MAITVNGAILRNMPEQISKNVDDIADLQTTSENYETRITALENSTILAATFQDCTFTGTTAISDTALNVSAPATFTAGLTADTVTAATVTATSLTVGSSTVSGNETVAGTLQTNGDFVLNNNMIFGSSSINAAQEFSGTVSTNISNSLTVAQSYLKAVVNFREIQFIFNCRLTNETASDVTLSNDTLIAQFSVSNTNITQRIYAHNGNSCNSATSQGSIAYCALNVSAANGQAITSNMPRYANLYHSNGGVFNFYLEGGSITIPANTTYDFEARITIAL